MKNLQFVLVSISLMNSFLLFSKVEFQQQKVFISQGNDSIIKKTDPKNLDLTQNQLFIDTTRISKFYQALERNFQTKKLSSSNFTSTFIRLRKVGNEFLLYDPCDGNDIWFDFDKDQFIFHGTHDKTIQNIEELKEFSNSKIYIQLNASHENELTEINIEPTKNSFVYKLVYQKENHKTTYFVTPLGKIKNFDLLVNHCAKEKVREFFTN